MHLVIMAAGEGSRMRPLTDTTPKPLLKICGKTIIEHNIEWIIEHFDDIYMIVKYKMEQFSDYFGKFYRGKKIHYIEQTGEVMGTGAAILALDGKLEGDFVVVSGDDLYDKKDLERLIHSNTNTTLVQETATPELFGVFTRNSIGQINGFVEKPTDPQLWNQVNIWCHKFHSDIFTDLKNTWLSPRGELEIGSFIDQYAKMGAYTVLESVGRWISLGYPWDILKANDEIIGKYKEVVDKWAIIEPNVTIKWNIFLEEWVILKSGTYIEGNVYFGKNCKVWPHTYIRGNTHFGDNTRAGSFSGIKWCYFGDATVIAQWCVIVDTIAGNDVNFWSGTITTNWRHDNTSIKALSKGILVNTGRRKLGAIVGDHTRFGANTTIYPGRTIPTNGTTLPGEIYK